MQYPGQPHAPAPPPMTKGTNAARPNLCLIEQAYFWCNLTQVRTATVRADKRHKTKQDPQVLFVGAPPRGGAR